MKLKSAVLGSLASIAFAVSSAGSIGAGEVRDAPKAVLELFTSQGCSSCPPADALLKELAGRKDIVALAYHVDYWDYAGWPDTFGAEANSQRQRDYAETWGSSRVYTPQLVVNGETGVVGSRRQEVSDAIAASSLSVPVTVSKTHKGMLAIDIPAKPGGQDALVWLVTYVDKANVQIERGENEGKEIDYTHVVTGHQMLGAWEAASGAHLKLPLSKVLAEPGHGAAVLVQEGDEQRPGRIIGAASIVQ